MPLLVAGCSSHNLEHRFIRPAEAAHGVHLAKPGTALNFDIEAEVGLQPPMRAHLLCDLNGARVRADFEDGVRVIAGPSGISIAFGVVQQETDYAQAHTWAQILLMPLRLRDPTLTIGWVGDMPCQKTTRRAAEFRDRNANGCYPFAGLIYADEQSGRIVALADTQRDEPYAVTYEHSVRVAGVLLADEWRYWPWSRETGPQGDYIGVAKLSNIAFVAPTADAFAIPAGAVRLQPPK